MNNFLKTQIETLRKAQGQGLPEIKPGDTVLVSQRISSTVVAKDPASKKAAGVKKEGKKVQDFEGIVIARKHGKEMGATITVRKVISGVGVERIFPLHLPTIEKIEVLKKGKVRRAKLYYLRTAKGKKGKLKQI